MKRLLLIPVAVGLIVGYVVSAQTPKPANLTVKAADSTSQPITQAQPTTSQPTKAVTDSPVVHSPAAQTPTATSTPPSPAPSSQTQVASTEPVTVTGAKAGDGSDQVDTTTGQIHYSYWCHLTYSDGSTADKQVNGTAQSGATIPNNCDQFIGQAK